MVFFCLSWLGKPRKPLMFDILENWQQLQEELNSIVLKKRYLDARRESGGANWILLFCCHGGKNQSKIAIFVCKGRCATQAWLCCSSSFSQFSVQSSSQLPHDPPMCSLCFARLCWADFSFNAFLSSWKLAIWVFGHYSGVRMYNALLFSTSREVQ